MEVYEITEDPGLLLNPELRLDGDERILAAQLDDTVGVSRLWDGPGDQRMAEAPQLVAVQIVHELVYQFWPGMRRWADAVPQQLLQDFRAIPVGHQRETAPFDEPIHAGCLTNSRASTISDGVPLRVDHHAMSRAYAAHAASTFRRPAAARA